MWYKSHLHLHTAYIRYVSFLRAAVKLAAARSIPLKSFTIFCKPAGNAGISAVVLVYNGKKTSPLQPESIVFTISFASSMGATTGAMKFEGVFIPLNMGVSSCPGATRMVLISGVPASSATSDWWKDSRPAFDAVYVASRC